MRLGGPPRSPRSGPSPEGPQSSPDVLQICEGPQNPSWSTKSPSLAPTASSGVQGSPPSGLPDSPRRAGLRIHPPFGRHLWIRRRPPCPEALGSAPRRFQAASRAWTSRALLTASPGSRARSAEREGGGSTQRRAEAQGEVLPGQRAGKMAAPMELFCWSGGWGLPSVDLDSLAVLVRGGAGALCCALEDWGGGRTSRSSEFCQGASVRAQWGKLRQSKSVPGRYELCSVPW